MVGWLVGCCRRLTWSAERTRWDGIGDEKGVCVHLPVRNFYRGGGHLWGAMSAFCGQLPHSDIPRTTRTDSQPRGEASALSPKQRAKRVRLCGPCASSLKKVGLNQAMFMQTGCWPGCCGGERRGFVCQPRQSGALNRIGYGIG